MDIDRLWKNTKEEMKVILAPAVFQTFIAKTQLTIYNKNKAIIACSSAYLVEINKKRYYQLFKNSFDNQTKTDNTLEFIVQENLKENKETKPAPLLDFEYKYFPSSS
jgi:hypothetical protein